jgi:hypothetical protein
MLQTHLYGHSLLVTALLVIGLCVGVALLGQWIVHRYVSLHVRLAHNQVIGFTSATCALIYVVLLAFIASTVWVSYDRADEAVSREASLVGDLFQDASMLPKALEAETIVYLRDYSRAVVNDEWPKMAKGERAKSEGWQLIRKFYTQVSQVTGITPVQVAVIQEMISRINHLYDIRRERLRTADRGSLNPAVWLVVLLGGLITIAFCWLFGFDKNWLHVLSTVMVSITLGLVIFLIVVFNCPFRGRMQISSAPFERMLKHMDKQIQAVPPPALP